MNDHTKIPIDFDPTIQRMKGVTREGLIEFDVPFVTKVTEDLWQGGCQQGLALPTHINYLVSLYPWERYLISHKMRAELYVRMYDDSTMPVDEQSVEDLAVQVNKWRKKGTVLVHCQAGLNRSSLVVARALMLDGMTADEAISTLRTGRSPACLSNITFEKWLKDRS